MADTKPDSPAPPLDASSLDDPPMFDTSLIPTSVKESLPASYTIRPAHPSDYHRGFLTVLATLTSTPIIPFSDFSGEMAAMNACKDTYYVLVICDKDGWVVGTGSLIVERKFIHGLGKVGHVEDISVRKDQQGKKLGLKLIQALEGVGRGVGCYKCILDCSEANEGFYVKCGFRRAGLEMAHYYELQLKKDEQGTAKEEPTSKKEEGEVKTALNAEANL